jgi:zinc protease
LRASALGAFMFASTVLATPSSGAQAMKIQEVKSPRGITAWLVEEHTVPLIAVRFAFEGGSAQDPIGKEGLANLVSGLLDEGAGDLTAKQFQERMEEIAMRLNFEHSKDVFYGGVETLTENRDEAMRLLSLAINKPRFDPADIERIRAQQLAELAYAARDPNRVAAEKWDALAFAGHPYGRPGNGTPESVQRVTRDDLIDYCKRLFARDTLRVVVVGDIDAKTVGRMLDQVFGDLPAKAKLAPVPDVMPKATEKEKVIEMDVPQSVARFGLPGIARKDKDFIPGAVLNQLLGGGGFASRLTIEVREKRGLAYSVYSYLHPYRHAAVFGGGVATKNEEIGRSLDVIRSEFKRMAAEGPTKEELDDAKKYLVGSYALRFDSNTKIANQLLAILLEDLGIDYVDRRNAEIEAVSLDDVRRVAKRLFEANEPIVTIVGKPKILTRRG